MEYLLLNLRASANYTPQPATDAYSYPHLSSQREGRGVPRVSSSEDQIMNPSSSRYPNIHINTSRGKYDWGRSQK